MSKKSETNKEDFYTREANQGDCSITIPKAPNTKCYFCYKVSANATDISIAEKLNEFAAEGWEFVGNISHYILIFKRKE